MCNTENEGDWRNFLMLAIACVLLYLAIVKKFEPLLLLPIAFGMLLTNIPGANMFHESLFAGGHVHWSDLYAQGGLLDYLY
ncbi:MAG: glutaconyl-CoA decarboxylase subunit beta, partial [Sphingobacteriia bacterium]|nr:glutaconyl-CoA decarboxylase subunit beta [Sphingobacteriia bacterium]